jgi:hypothetical protein
MIGAALQAILSGATGTTIFAMSPTGTFDVINIDVTTRRSHEDPGTLADFPVEGGIDGTDNYHEDPPVIVIEGVITDTPVSFLGIGGGPNRAIEIYKRLRDMKAKGEPVFVATEIRGSSDMVLVSIVVDEDADTGDAIPVVLTFRKATILQTLLVPIDFDFDALVVGAGGTADLGTQSTINPLDYTGPTQSVPVSPF